MKLHKTVQCPGCKGKGSVEIINTDALRSIREASGLSLRKMAERLGFSAPYISDIERGRRACTLKIAGEYNLLRAL